MKRTLATALAIAMLLAACASNPTQSPSQTTNNNIHARSELTLDGTFNSLMEGLLDDGGENSCISPLSYKLALAMAYNGAAGGTKTLLNALFAQPPEQMNAWAKVFLKNAEYYDGKDKTADLRVANSYWVRKGDALNPDFVSALEKNFNAESGEFTDSPDKINKWVSKNTNKKIDQILDKINPQTISYLINALYFKAEWHDEFLKENTKPMDFTNRDGTVSTPQTMNGFADGYIETPDYKGITKSLSSGFTFTALMGDKPATIETLTAARKNADRDYASIKLALPKFDFDTKVDFAEGKHPEYDALFAPGGMSGAAASPEDDLFISQIVHKTTFTCAESGIEASAVTVVMMDESSAMRPSEREIEIKFDKPFTFALTDQNGEVLFYGRVNSL